MKKRIFISLLTVLITCAMLQSIALAATSIQGETNAKIYVYKKPGTAVKNRFLILKEGATVVLVAQTENFYKILTKSGKVGYVRKQDITVKKTASSSSTASETKTETVTEAPVTLGPSVSSEDIYTEFLALVNKARAENGASPLAYDEKLQKGADIRAKEQLTLFSHTRVDGSGFSTIFDEVGFTITMRGVAENIAMAYKTPQEVFDGWMSSDGHRENLMNPSYSYIGLGKASDSSGTFWVALFG